MIRDIVVTLVLVLLAIGGLWVAGIGRETISGAIAFVAGSGEEAPPAQDDLPAVTKILDGGRVWCFWPDGEGRCAWALRAEQAPAAAGFDVSIFASRASRVTDAGLVEEITVARSGLVFVEGRLCEDRDRPTTQERLGYYEALDGVMAADVRLRPASEADFADFMADVPESGGALVCFRFEESERAPDGAWLMHVETDGVESAPPEEFVIRAPDAVVRLAPPPG